MFALVAGGLGERLGFNGIKTSITLETVTGQSFMEYYIEYIKAFEKNSGKEIPLVIMVSDDTDALTRQFLEEKKNFGLKKIHILK